MRKLVKGPAPAILSSQAAIDSINALKNKVDNGEKIERADIDSKIYNDKSVKTQLLLDQSCKCAYCESRMKHVSPGNIDHYRPVVACSNGRKLNKTNPGYYWLAYDWDNLIFSCEQCNHCKLFYFPLRNNSARAKDSSQINNEERLLLNPYTDDPHLHLEFNQHYVKGKDDIGKFSIEYYGLQRAELVEARRSLWQRYEQKLILDKIMAKLPNCPELKQIESLQEDFSVGEYSSMIDLQKTDC